MKTPIYKLLRNSLELVFVFIVEYRRTKTDSNCKMVYTITSAVNVEEEKNNDKGSVWKQLLLSVIVSLPFFTHGIVTNTLSTSAHAGHFIVTPDEVPLSSTVMILGAIFSAPVFCYLIDRFGRKIGIYGINLVQGASCVPLFLTPIEVNVTVLHLMAGITSGGLFTVLPIYVREISSDRHREFNMSLMMLMISSGYIMRVPMEMEEMMYLIVTLVAVQLISMYFLVETPAYLIKVNKFESASRNIARLYGLPPGNSYVTEQYNLLKSESDKAKSHGKLTFISILRNKIWRDGFKIGIVLFTIMILNGSIMFLDQEKALEQLKLDTDPKHRLVLYSLFAGGLVCTLLIKFLERKHLLSMAFVVVVLSMGVLAVYTQVDLTVSSQRWQPVVSLVVLVFGFGVAWGLPTIAMIEIFNLEIRATLLGVIYSYSQIIKILHIHSFKYIEDYIGVYTMFYIFAAVNIYGAVYSLFAIPNLRNKNVKQIEKQLKRVPLLYFKSVVISKSDDPTPKS